MQTKTIKLSKLDAARRQLDSAIRLWFSCDDPVTIHTLVCAAYQIIQDMNNHNKEEKLVTLVEIINAIVKPESRQQYLRAMRKPMTFFKHAERDPRDILTFDSRLSETFMVVAINGLISLGEQISDVQRAFCAWNDLHHPERYYSGVIKRDSSDAWFAKMRQIKKEDFLEVALIGLVQARARRR